MQLEHVPRAYSKHLAALAILASKVDITNKVINVRVVKKTLGAITEALIPVNPIRV